MSEHISSLLSKYKKLLRFVISGGSATCVNILLLYVLTEHVHLWYLLSSIVAFLSAFLISFFLQKFWTFEDPAKDRMHTQFMQFLITMLAGLAFNTFLMYICVEYAHFPYILGQVLAGIVIAILNFIVYQKLIFKKNESI
jgi:putative flippase GtrA